jgi:DNA-binding SARP family transcriptional activator
VPTARLIEVLWGDDPPPSDRNSLQTYVARRRRLGRGLRGVTAGADDGGGPIVTLPPGYLLEVGPDQVDALRFESLLTAAGRSRAGDPAHALELLDEALGLWRGPAYAEFADEDVARAEAVRLEALREAAGDERIETLLALGRVAEAVGELESAVADHPFRERPYAQLMGALARGGRQVEALRLYQGYRQRLGELGLEPSPALRELEGEILRQAPSVGSPRRLLSDSPAGNLPAPATSFVGRDRELVELMATLGRARIVTLVGPGGVGKTRLAHRVVELVASLVEKSMVLPPAGDSPGRYALLETLRQYGAERLIGGGGSEGIARAHAEYFVTLAEEADVALQGPDEREWVARVRADLDNLRAAHAWCRQRGEAALALRLSTALHRFACWQINDEILTWAAAAAELPSALGHPLLPVVHGSAGVGACRRGDLAGAVAHAEAGLAAAAGDHDPARALPLEVLGDVWGFSGSLDDAFNAYGEAVRLGRTAGDLHGVVYCLVSQALARAYPGDVATALALADEVRELASRSKNPTALAWALYVRGESLLEADPTQALALLEESLEAAASADNVFVTGVALLSATSLRGRYGEPGRALRSYRDAIEHWHRHGNWTQQWITLRNLIELLARVGAGEPAAVIYGATNASATAPPTFGPEARRLAAVVALLSRGLGLEALDEATQRGAALSDEEVVAFATTAIERILAASGIRPLPEN